MAIPKRRIKVGSHAFYFTQNHFAAGARQKQNQKPIQMKTHNPNRVFAYWALLIPCMTTVALLFTAICSGCFTLSENPMPGNIFDTGFLLGILWFVGLLVTLNVKVGNMQTYKVYKDSQGREIKREKSDDVSDAISDSFIYPLLARFVIFPLMGAAMIYYAVYLLLSLLIVVLPYLLGALCIGLAIGIVMWLNKQLHGDENTDSLFNLTARQYGLPIMVAATLFCMPNVLQSVITFLYRFSGITPPAFMGYIIIALPILSGILFLTGSFLMIRKQKETRSPRSTAVLVSLVLAGLAMSGILDVLSILLYNSIDSIALNPYDVSFYSRIILALCAMIFALVSFLRDKELRKQNRFYNSALKLLLLISVLAAAANLLNVVLIPLMLFFWKKYYAEPGPAEVPVSVQATV